MLPINTIVALLRQTNLDCKSQTKSLKRKRYKTFVKFSRSTHMFPRTQHHVPFNDIGATSFKMSIIVTQSPFSMVNTSSEREFLFRTLRASENNYLRMEEYKATFNFEILSTREGAHCQQCLPSNRIMSKLIKDYHI